MTKFRLYFDKDKEILWLNKMAQEGWTLKHFFMGFYTFTPCEKGEFVYQVDFSSRLGSVSKDYRSFMEEAGIEVVQVWGFWVILRKRAAEGEFVLYSDVDSQIGNYKKILLMFKIVGAIELLCATYLLSAAIIVHRIEFAAFACVALAFAFVFIRMIVRTKNIIRELKERKTGIKEDQSRQVSPLLSVGMLLNSVALLSKEHIETHWILYVIMSIAIVTMLAGIVHTVQQRKKNS